MNFFLHRILMLLLFYLFCGNLTGNEISLYSLYYSANANGIKGKAQRVLTRLDANTLELTNSLEATFAGQIITSLKETSKVEIFENSIRPKFYSLQQDGITRASLEIAYDWSAMLVSSNSLQQLSRFKLRPNTYDPLSHQLILQQQTIEGKAELTFTVVNKNDIETYAYQILGEEKIVTPLGAFESIKIARTHGKNSGRETIFWLALDFEGILLRARQTTPSGINIFLEIQSGIVNDRPITGAN